MSDDRPVLLFGETYHHPNILYRTGFLVPDPIVVVDQGGDDTVLWASALEEGRARKESKVGTVRSTSELDLPPTPAGGNEYTGWANLVTAVCREHGLNAVDVDADFPTVLADELRQHDVDVRPRTDIYEYRRRIKTAEEVEWITATENAGMAALQKAIDVIKAAEIRDGLLFHEGRTLTSDDLIYTVESDLLEHGNSTTDSICCGGPESADPHRTNSDVIRAGLPIVLDIYPFDKRTRYWGDMTRTVVRGTPPAAVERMWEAVLEAQQAGLDTVRPGANGRDVHYACCEVFKKHGYGSLARPYRDIQSDARFIHGTGHGLGLEIHEFPRISEAEVVLEVGDVITVEPGLYDPNLGGIRIEDLVVVTETGCRNLTTLPKTFRLD
ncbi:MAG: Xaa-Pro peptidase family protein [Candidatus Dormiibacterota bacterium]